MLNSPLKFAAAKKCVGVCITALLLNSFVLASTTRPPFARLGKQASTVPVASQFDGESVKVEQNPSPSPTPPPRPRISPAKDKMAAQSSQGQQYGQSGFVGEPINLNAVNADVRDILNYITEQYGVNFVIDSSVGAIPVPVNVQ